MRYPADQKAKARAALIDAGARSFYSNFANKEAMLEAVGDAFVGEPFLSDTETGSVAEHRARLLSFLDEYIGTDHSADPAGGCVMPALSADVSRARPPVREAYERKISTLAQRVAGLLDGTRSDRGRRAWSLDALMVGALTISRAMTDQGESRAAVIQAAQRTALSLVD